MELWTILVAALALSVERICYVWIWRFPEIFARFCALPSVRALGGPVEVIRKLFFGFKVIQVSVFVWWCWFYGDGFVNLLTANTYGWSLGALLIVVGQILNFSVFMRLGEIGVFYGNRFGYSVPWRREFPFSVLRHPQYVGAVLSIWGFFLVMRFPHEDWYMLPTVETVYYVLGSYLEE